MDIQKLEKFLRENYQPTYRLKQIKHAVFQDGTESFLKISTLPLELRNILNKEVEILPFRAEKILFSQNNEVIKALLIMKDGEKIESVLIAPKPGIWSVCVSSQAGCSLKCAFCATGQNGFRRNLTNDEITGQILFWRQYLKNKKGEDISTIVFMGMGEPFLNWENVQLAIKNLKNPELFNIGSRNISLSTVGITGGIEKLMAEFPQINLAVSLHFADNETRSRFMPANKKYNLVNLREDLKKYFVQSRRKVFLEYILLDKINDQPKDARNLVCYLKSIGDLKLLHINLIRYNDIENNFKPSSRETSGDFKEILEKNRIHCTIRKSLGDDIQGACGQLAGK